MDNFILFFSAGLVFFLGWVCLARMDLATKRFTSDTEAASPDVIRVAFENPALAESVSTELDRFTEQNPSCRIVRYCGTVEEILKKLNEGAIDFGFLYDIGEMHSDVKYYRVPCASAGEETGTDAEGLPVYALCGSGNSLKALWSESPKRRPETEIFAKQLLHTA